jgi:hypothetical protein
MMVTKLLYLRTRLQTQRLIRWLAGGRDLINPRILSPI